MVGIEVDGIMQRGRGYSRKASIEGSTSSMSREPKVPIFTGAPQGIGASPVTRFHERGYRVVANSRSIRAWK
jgi:hypothetical protein